jgi:hypothetical protein
VRSIQHSPPHPQKVVKRPVVNAAAPLPLHQGIRELQNSGLAAYEYGLILAPSPPRYRANTTPVLMAHVLGPKRRVFGGVIYRRICSKMFSRAYKT